MTQDHTHSGQRVLEWEQGTFSILPHWILFSPISSNAVRTYAVLAKYRDADTGQAFPSRATLAKDVGVRSVRSIDGYLRELRDIGALSIKRRRKPGSRENYTSVYRVMLTPPGVVQSDALPSAADCAENYNHLTTTTSDTPAPATPMRVNDPLPDSLPTPGVGRERAEQADPISPAWYRSHERAHAIELVQQAAARHADGDTDGVVGALYGLDDLLAHTLHADADQLNDLREHDGWAPPKKATSRLHAAIWLNQYLGTLRAHGLL